MERDVRALATLGWFDSITVTVSPVTTAADGDEAGLDLVFVLEERPYLGQVEFDSSCLLSRDRIKQLLAEKKITLKLTAPVDRFALWRASRAIREELQELGHPQADVRVILEDMAPATIRARFEIEDGARMPAGNVTFAGNRAFSDDLLRSHMRRVAPGALFAGLRDKDVYTRERLDEDLARVADYYRDHGYPMVRIGTPAVEIRLQGDRRWFPWPSYRKVARVHVSVPIAEGAFYRLGAVEVRSDLPVAGLQDRIGSLLASPTLRRDRPYSEQELERLRDALSEVRLAEDSKGRSISPDVTVRQEIDPATGTATALLRIY